MQFIYLDLNKWVDLSRCYFGKNEKLRPVLDSLIAAGLRKEICCPASTATLIEVRKKRNSDQRERLAEFISRISGGVFMAPPSVLQDWELKRAVSKTLGIPIDLPRNKLFGHGVAFAFGMTRDDPSFHNMTDEAFDRFNSPQGSYFLMAGSTETEEIFESGRQLTESQATDYVRDIEQYRENARSVSKEMRRRGVAANELLAFQPQITRILKNHNLQFNDLLNVGRHKLLKFFSHSPSLDCWIKLSAARNEHHDRKVEKNDMLDLRALSIAIPYCQAVITEKFWTRLVKQEKLDDTYTTLVSNRLEDLVL